ncbi:hypothetical protein ACQP10_38315 (plasmid) [Streptosporangium sandarakinum]|uniref:hypothetical protein n=1 Tax=Streptosporangium sandarakinum TaxID=1260955 RepID=UPI003D922A6A
MNAQTSPAPLPLTDRIRIAYNLLADDPGLSFVSIADVRRMVGTYQATPEGVDAALREMAGLPDVSIRPARFMNVTLSRDDREGAVSIGGRECHLLWIG